MGFIESAAVVLRSSDFGESDRIVSFLAKDHGRLRAIARGARASRKRFGWNLEPLSQVRLRAWESPAAGLLRLESCDLVRPFGTSGDLAQFAAGSYVMELVEAFTGEREPCAGVFDLLVEFLGAIAEAGLRPDHLRIFEARLLAEAGYSPRVDSCVGCSTPRSALAKGLFIPERGGVLCDRCAREHRGGGYPLSRQTIDHLAEILVARGGDVWQIALPPASARECARLLPGFLTSLTGREIRTLKFLREVWPEGIPD